MPIRQYLGQLASGRVQRVTGCSDIQALREHVATAVQPGRLLGLIASPPIWLYQLWSCRREVCRHPRGRNCSVVVSKSFRLYGILTGTAVAYLLVVIPALGDESGDGGSRWCD